MQQRLRVEQLLHMRLGFEPIPLPASAPAESQGCDEFLEGLVECMQKPLSSPSWGR